MENMRCLSGLRACWRDSRRKKKALKNKGLQDLLCILHIVLGNKNIYYWCDIAVNNQYIHLPPPLLHTWISQVSQSVPQ